MQVQDIMSQPVVSVCATDSLHSAAELMWDCDCGVVPVVNGNGRAIAMLTDRDICMAAHFQGRPLSEIGVCIAMSSGLVACLPRDSISDVEQIMRNHQIRRLPVLNEQGEPIGMISLSDIARAATRQLPAAHGDTHGVSEASAAKTLAAVCAHRLDRLRPRLA